MATTETERPETPYGAPAEPSWREVDWPRHLHRVQLDGAELTYVDIGAGDGPPIVFIHGLGGQWSNWLENLPAAAQARRAIALDLPGFGHSDMPAEKISIAGYAAVVDRLCEHLQLGPVVVVGNSMGGFIGAELAMQRPDRVERLVLVGAAGIVPSRAERLRALPFLRAMGLLSARMAAASRHIATRPRLRRLALSMVAAQPARLRADLVFHAMTGPAPAGFGHALEAALSYISEDWCTRLPEIRCPTLLVWGAGDAILPVRHCEEFSRYIPHARTLVWPDAGHVPMLERPGPFNQALLEFVAEPATSGGG